MAKDPEEHDNMYLKRARGVKKATVAESIREDGTLVTEVTCSFVVSHAARCNMDEDTLTDLLNDALAAEHIDPCHINSYKIIEANNE